MTKDKLMGRIQLSAIGFEFEDNGNTAWSPFQWTECP